MSDIKCENCGHSVDIQKYGELVPYLAEINSLELGWRHIGILDISRCVIGSLHIEHSAVDHLYPHGAMLARRSISFETIGAAVGFGFGKDVKITVHPRADVGGEQ